MKLTKFTPNKNYKKLHINSFYNDLCFLKLKDDDKTYLGYLVKHSAYVNKFLLLKVDDLYDNVLSFKISDIENIKNFAGNFLVSGEDLSYLNKFNVLGTPKSTRYIKELLYEEDEELNG